MADIKWDQGYGFQYYAPSGDINQALATRDTQGNITITDYAKQNLSTTELVSLMQDLGLAGPPAPPPEPPPPPKLTEQGSQAEWALGLIGAGGDKQSILSQINAKVAEDLNANTPEALKAAQLLTAIASNYRDAELYANSNTQGIAYLRQVQQDLTAGKYDTASKVAPPTPPPPPTQGQYQGWGFTYDSPDGDVNNATQVYLPPPPPTTVQTPYSGEQVTFYGPSPASEGGGLALSRTTGDDAVSQLWPQLDALETKLVRLSKGTWTVHPGSIRGAVKTIIDEQNRELLRQMRARGYG